MVIASLYAFNQLFEWEM